MTGFTYKSYNFIDRDPIIDEMRTVYQDSGVNYVWIREHSGLSVSTLTNWFNYGQTKRPHNASVEAFLRCLGYERKIVAMGEPVKITPAMPQSQPKPQSKPRNPARHVIQMAKYRKRK